MLEEEIQQDANEVKHLKDNIKVRDLNFSYDLNVRCLKEINLEIPYGQKVALLGESGSGDSDIMMTDTINPLKSKFKGFHKTFKQDDLGLSLSSFLLN
ncbi:hypothetical protein [Aerococcus sp. UMB8487]|uniref:hypothetical protein n=1 Tax=Aerococcus sp. UMB8487 TaxID=3046346 RepID=UPI00254FEF4D|nr:hypothetical protein [Aerococcus sp. UMB8487]MDK6941172.1 hypothetical protein [Aerococcus sp. UMB8487]